MIGHEYGLVSGSLSMLEPMSSSIAVITVSDRSFVGARPDVSGPLAAHLLGEFGTVTGPALVPDGIESVQHAIAEAIRSGADVVVTTGGTGITPRDLTPEGTEPLLTRRLPGIEALMRNNPAVATAALSRGLAGIATVHGRDAFVINAPGSTGGVRDVVAAVGPLLAHIVEQMRGEETLHVTMAAAKPPVMNDHQTATWAIQHRGTNDGSDARVIRAGVSNEPIDMAQLIAEVNDDSAGAVVSFCGQVRNHDDARAVTAIDYEAHPDANVVVEQIVRQVEAGSGACKIAILHRVGHLDVGDVALGAAVSASHRNEAFAVLERVVEEVKLKLPVWKKQEFTDGSHEWTGCA